MLMPEASVDKNDFVVTHKNNVWFARQSALMKAESESHAMDEGTDGLLRSRILTPDL